MDDLEKQPNEKKQMDGYKIVGVNIALFITYAVVLNLIVNGFDAAMLFANIFISHFLICLILATFTKNWYWLLSGFIILIVGYSVCGRTTVI